MGRKQNCSKQVISIVLHLYELFIIFSKNIKLEQQRTCVNFLLLRFFSGKVYQGNTRLVPDFGIVPIDGFPIDKTVAEIATSTWLVIMEIYLLIDNTIIIKIKCQKQGH